MVLAVGLAVSPDAGASQGQAIVNAAASQAGLQYCWDGGTPTGPTRGTSEPGTGRICGAGTLGFDCTGLTLYAVYQATGKVLSHDGHQATEGGQIISNPAELQPGDLVFFGGTLSNFEHAGVYAGNGQFWDANDWGVPVQLHTMAWEEAGLPFVGGARYWSGEGGGGIGEGSFVSHDGFVYRIAGGAPIYVSSWNAVGGAQPTTPLSDAQFAALPQFPRDGTFLDASGGGVFIVAGGAPLYLSNWASVGGPKPGIAIDEAAVNNAGAGVPWDHLRSRPADGTLIASTATGMVYEMAGGAPLYVSNWAAIGGARPVVSVDEWDIENTANPLAHLSAAPANGTLINSTATGMVYEIAGGAPMYVSNWAAIGGARSSVGIDQWDLDNIANPAAHLNTVPSNGTLLGASGGGVFIVAGGAPMYLSSWNAIGGPQPSVAVDQWDIDNISNPAAHLNAVPADGTFLNTSTGHVYRVAGGAPFAVSNWSVFGGEQPYVTVDEWDIDNAASPAAHLNVAPADGTVVEGLPSGTYWSFTSGLRSELLATAGAVTVDDVGLAAYPEYTSPVNAASGAAVVRTSTPQTHVEGSKSTVNPIHLTSKQILARALARCGQAKTLSKRVACESAARRRYRHELQLARERQLVRAVAACRGQGNPRQERACVSTAERRYG